MSRKEIHYNLIILYISVCIWSKDTHTKEEIKGLFTLDDDENAQFLLLPSK